MNEADRSARDRIRSDLAATLVVEAAAGTGKTTELIRRMLAVLRSGVTQLEKMVALTFTESAAGELKLRLRREIELARADPATPELARGLLTDSLPSLEEARIGTIHGFCADLLRERPVEALVDPGFEVASEDVARSLRDLAFDRWFERQLASPGEGVRRILRRGGRNGPRLLLRRAAEELIERRDFPAPWQRDEAFDRVDSINSLLDEMAAVAEGATGGDLNDPFTKSLLEIGRFVNEVKRREVVRGRDYDGLEAELVQFSRRKEWGWAGFRKWPANYPKEKLREQRATAHEHLLEFRGRAGAEIAPLLREELWPVVESYERLKARAGRLDFLDLLIRVRDLLRTNQRVRMELQERFSHLFIDEFQDVDPVQMEILLLMASGDPAITDWRRVPVVPGKLFLVADPKQSIYRFRRADVALYRDVQKRLIAGGGSLVNLTVSFRAVPELQEVVNATFAPIMRGQSISQAEYVALAPNRTSHEGQPAVIALPVPRPYGVYRKIVKWKIEESLPDAVAAFVHWLVTTSGWTVTERDKPDERVPLRPRHVCLLFRRFRSFFKDVTRDYIRALEARRIPHLLVGGASFHTREEVEAIRNALSAIERPWDELSIFATLRGPLFALSDAQLLAFRSRYPKLHPFSPVSEELPEELQEVADSLEVLRNFHRGRNRRPIADTIAMLLEATRAHAGLAIWPTGEQALANVTRLMDLARRAERNGVASFQAFVDRLVDEEARGEASDAPILEEGTEGVRIMTVHKAKGLEFPVVLLADLTANETPEEPSRWVDAARGLCAVRLAGCTPPELRDHAAEEMELEREEAARLLYVAATRARDLLVVPVVGDGRQGGWLSALNAALYPPDTAPNSPANQHPPGCPQLGMDTVLRPPNVSRPAISVVPGLHKPEAGAHHVVWWDPSLLDLDVRESAGLRQQQLLEADESGLRSQEGIRAHAEWQTERARVRDQGGKPSVTVVTATERAALMPASEVTALAKIALESIPSEQARPAGKRFGNLVHAVLAAVDLDSSLGEVQSSVSLYARALGATEQEADSAVAVVVRTLEQPLLRRAAAAARAGRCRREAPITTRAEDGTLIEGILDIAFLEVKPEPIWTVVDFKTDTEMAGKLEQYRRQVGLYTRGVAEATGLPARGVLLQI